MSSPTALLVTTPIRPIPTTFPPFGSLSLVSYLRRHGIEDIEFYNIDAERPEYDEALRHIRDVQPRVLGISAVVSTAYEYTKRLSLDVKRHLPSTLIVCGGNLAASAEILLRKTGVDACVLGEGERPFLEICRRAGAPSESFQLSDIRGLMLLGPEGELVNTGFEQALDKDEIYEIDWADLVRAEDDLDHFFPVLDRHPLMTWFTRDPRFADEHRRGKRLGHLAGAKGCVARCTFCHRWEKGIRYIPVETVMRRLDHMIEQYNVGYVDVVDENFGTDRRWLAAFCEEIAKRDVLWRVAGMRVNCISPDFIDMMHRAGCGSILYGMETGSSRILEVMEKKTTVEDNRNAMKWTVERGLWTGVQLVLGMPGETPSTVRETTEFAKYALTLSPGQNPNDLSINYAQALPGTPLYEFGRSRGLIGRSLDEEEAYLLDISDKDAHDEINTRNFTEYPTLVCQSWRPRITVETNYAYVRSFGMDHYLKRLARDNEYFHEEPEDSGYFANPKRLVDTASVMTDTVNEARGRATLRAGTRRPPLMQLLRQGQLGLAMISYPVLFYRLRHFLPVMLLMRAAQRNGAGYAWSLLGEYLAATAKRVTGRLRFPHSYMSLRKLVANDIGPLAGDNDAMAPLRRGR